MGSAGKDVPKSKSKGKKRQMGEFQDFTVEYAKSSRARCRGCEEKINKVRKKKLDSFLFLYNIFY